MSLVVYHQNSLYADNSAVWTVGAISQLSVTGNKVYQDKEIAIGFVGDELNMDCDLFINLIKHIKELIFNVALGRQRPQEIDDCYRDMLSAALVMTSGQVFVIHSDDFILKEVSKMVPVAAIGSGEDIAYNLIAYMGKTIQEVFQIYGQVTPVSYHDKIIQIDMSDLQPIQPFNDSKPKRSKVKTKG